MEKISYKETLIAICIRSFAHGSNPVTDATDSLQVMTLKRGKGEEVKAHFHAPKHRETERVQECLLVRKGSVEVDLFGNDNVLFRTLLVSVGEALLLLSGGHAVRYLEDTEIIEVKNGPYIPDKELI